MKNLFKIIFFNQGQVFEIYARRIDTQATFGFVAVEEIVFGERSAVVVDPSEEKLKAEFDNVKRTYIPLQAVIRIDEVDKQGASKVSQATEGNISQFPMPLYPPRKTD